MAAVRDLSEIRATIRKNITKGFQYYLHAYNDIAKESFEYALNTVKEISIQQKNSKDWNNEGILYHYFKQYDDAINCFDKAIELNPSNYKAFRNKGLSLRNLGDFHEALRFIEKSLVIYPDYYIAINSKGVVLDDLNQYDKAIECFDDVIKKLHLMLEIWANMR